MARRRAQLHIESLDAHPNAEEIRGVLARVPHIADSDVPRLASAWSNTVFLAEARGRALSPDSPLVVEVLAEFDRVQAMFAVSTAPEPDAVVIDPEVVTIALKAIRDAIAAAYAQPVIGRAEHAALLRAWREVYPYDDISRPDLGTRDAEVRALLTALPRLATRCHDPAAARDFDVLADAVVDLDDDLRLDACRETWQAAVLTSRRRLWTLVRRTGSEGSPGRCPSCGAVGDDDESSQRVLASCLDAACALLVADAVADSVVDVLTTPVRLLIPAQRSAR